MTRVLRYVQAAEIVRAQVSDGTLKPGSPSPSAASLARLTGFSPLTCRKALRSLVAQGVLVPGTSPSARPRVAVLGGPPAGIRAAALARALVGRRRAAGLSQPDLAALTGYSITTVGHAETGRLWQSRAFWEKADAALGAGGELARLHDAYRAGIVSPVSEEPLPPTKVPVPVPRLVSLVRMTMHWSDGSCTTVCPPMPPALPDH